MHVQDNFNIIAARNINSPLRICDWKEVFLISLDLFNRILKADQPLIHKISTKQKVYL